MLKTLLIVKMLLLLSLAQGCSGDNGFHLRKSVTLPSQFHAVYLENLSTESVFYNVFSLALSEAGGHVVDSKQKAKSVIDVSRFDEGRRVIAYDSKRVAREYLLYLKINYTINQSKIKSQNKKKLPFRINIDRSYLFDSNFALGKAEEEKQVKQALYEEAARLILLRIQYIK